MTLGDKIINLRLSARYSRKDICSILGISQNTIYRWENNICLPRRNMIKKLSELFSVPCDWLFEKNTEMTTLNNDDIELLDLFHKAPDKAKSHVLTYLNMYDSIVNIGGNYEFL